MRDTIDMAREAGFMLRAESVKGQSDWWECFDEAIEKLVALVRADEREACVKLIESRKTGANELMDTVRDMEARAIRARGNT
jgi:hypothetical protein